MSIDTKQAAFLVCDALSLIESGRAEGARKLLIHALVMLPDINDPKQDAAEAEFRADLKLRFGDGYAF